MTVVRLSIKLCFLPCNLMEEEKGVAPGAGPVASGELRDSFFFVCLFVRLGRERVSCTVALWETTAGGAHEEKRGELNWLFEMA